MIFKFKPKPSTGVLRHFLLYNHLTPRDMAFRNKLLQYLNWPVWSEPVTMPCKNSSEHLPYDNYRPSRKREGGRERGRWSVRNPFVFIQPLMFSLDQNKTTTKWNGKRGIKKMEWGWLITLIDVNKQAHLFFCKKTTKWKHTNMHS